MSETDEELVFHGFEYMDEVRVDEKEDKLTPNAMGNSIKDIITHVVSGFKGNTRYGNIKYISTSAEALTGLYYAIKQAYYFSIWKHLELEAHLYAGPRKQDTCVFTYTDLESFKSTAANDNVESENLIKFQIFVNSSTEVIFSSFSFSCVLKIDFNTIQKIMGDKQICEQCKTNSLSLGVFTEFIKNNEVFISFLKEQEETIITKALRVALSPEVTT